jgi:hypothetical protein
LWPVYILAIFHEHGISLDVYAVLWGYIPGYPFWNSDFGMDILLTAFMLPFASPGLMIAYYSYRSILGQTKDRFHYVSEVLVIQLIQWLLIWVIMPWTISSDPVLRLPSAITGLIALPFVSKIERLTVPWAKQTGVES